MTRQITPEKLVDLLQTMLSFDRLRTKEFILDEARDLMLAAGWPVANDFRPQGLVEEKFWYYFK
jgi:hypothetical protein